MSLAKPRAHVKPVASATEVSGYLVGSTAFKAAGTSDPRPAGSIPVHLRQTTACALASATAVAEATTAIETVERVDLGPHHFFHTLQHQLGYSIAATHVILGGRIGVQ